MGLKPSTKVQESTMKNRRLRGIVRPKDKQNKNQPTDAELPKKKRIGDLVKPGEEPKEQGKQSKKKIKEGSLAETNEESS